MTSQLVKIAVLSVQGEDSAEARSPECSNANHGQDRAEVATKVLVSLSERDREALIRYYTDRQDAATIQRDLGISDEEFRLIKTRARGSFAAFGGKAPGRSFGRLPRLVRA